MLLRKLTRTERGEFVLRLPKWMIPPPALKSLWLIVSKNGKYLVIEAASERLAQLREGRLLRIKRHGGWGKAT